MTISVEATVDTADEIDVDVTAPRVPIDEVPDWALQFLLPSRYCQSDLVFTNAIEITAGALPGYPQVEAIRAWIEREVRYEYGTSSAPDVGRRHDLQPRPACAATSPTSASPCAAASTSRPAWSSATSTGSTRWTSTPGSRPTSAVAGSRSTPPSPYPRGNRVTIAYGRDAADVAFVTQFGPVELEQMYVYVRPALELPPVDTGPVRRTPNVRPTMEPTSRPQRRGPTSSTSPGRRTSASSSPPTPGGPTRYLIEVGDLRIDYSKQRIDDAVLAALQAVADDGRRGGPPRRDVRRRADQRHREPPGAARRAAGAGGRRSSRSTATTSSPTSTRCSGGWATSPTRCATARGRAPPASASAPSSTSASAAPTSARRWRTGPSTHYRHPDLDGRFVSNVDGADIAGGARRARPRRDAVHRVVEDVHDRRDADQRPHGAGVARRRRSARTPWPSTSSPSARTPPRSRSSASTRPTCSGSGSGSAAATRSTRRSACR